MGLLRYLINIPVMVLLIWFLFDAHLGEKGIEFSFLSPNCEIKLAPALFVFFLFGYVFARLDAWFSYAPLRYSLKSQQRENRELNKEHAKLHETVDNLKQNIEGLKEKNSAMVSAEQQKLSFWQRIKHKLQAKRG